MNTTYSKNAKGEAISSTLVEYQLQEINTMKTVFDEETERTHRVREILRPEMSVQTFVNRRRNRFNHVKLYGPQGVQLGN